MNQVQMNAAKESMVEWLKHPAELGKAPSKIECVGEFDLYDLHYYIFKYKKGLFGKWLLGVCGGYEEDALENCGHTFSEMQEYNEASAKEDAVALVEYVRNYIIEQAERAENHKENPGTFVNFVLLKKPEWDKDKFMKQLKEDWDIEADDNVENEEDEERDDILMFAHEGAMVAVSLIPAPVPDGEAEYHAQSNYRWREAVNTVKQHKAHLMVAVMGSQIEVMDAAQLLVKVVASCCKMSNVLGVYANETVYQPEFYLESANMMKEDMYPILNLVWFGMYSGKDGLCCCTCGMNNLGYDEIEILDTDAAPAEAVDFLLNISAYIVTEDVTLQDGETIGFTEDQKLPITRSKGVAVEGESIKIGFKSHGVAEKKEMNK